MDRSRGDRTSADPVDTRQQLGQIFTELMAFLNDILYLLSWAIPTAAVNSFMR